MGDLLQAGQKVQFSQPPGAKQALPAGVVGSIAGDCVVVAFPSRAARLSPGDLLHRRIEMSWEKEGVEHECPVSVEGILENALRLRIRFDERREFKRVPTRLTLTYEEIPPESVADVAAQIMSETPSREDLEIEADRFWRSDDLAERIDEQFSQLTRFMEQVNAKLDYLIAVEEGREKPLAPSRTADLITISGAGISFLERRAVSAGTFLKTRIFLSRFPLREIVCLGNVVRVDKQTDGLWNIGVRFEHIHEDDREKIFRFVSRVERKILRERKEGATA